MAEVMLACRGLRKAYGQRVAVDGVSLEIARGETYGLLGPNGVSRIFPSTPGQALGA